MITLNAAPIFLVYFFEKGKVAWKKPPIPIYLSEELTGLYVSDDEDSLTISTDYLVKFQKENGVKKQIGDLVVQQKGEGQESAINLIGRKDSIGLNIFLPLFKSIYDRVIKESDYRIAYFNKNVLIFNARLSRFEKKQSRENNLVNITVGLTVSPTTEEEEENAPTAVLGKASDAVPVRG